MTITIGIPAYNEEKNIVKLLHSILAQKEDRFILRKIIIVSDASSDNTDNEVLSIKDKRIELVKNKKRKGQAFAQNIIFNDSDSDVVVLFEADTLLGGENYLNYLISKMLRNPKIGVVQGYWKPLPSVTLVGKILEKQMVSYQDVVINRPDNAAMLVSGRGGRAFRRFVYKKLRWISNVPEDVFAILWCEEKNIPYSFEERAVAYYRSPQSLEDYIKERQKIISAHYSLTKHFDVKTLEKMYDRPKSVIYGTFLNYLIRYPWAVVPYIGFKTYANLKLHKKSFTDFWPKTHSTKSL